MAYKYQTFADLLYASYSGLQTLGFAFAKGKKIGGAESESKNYIGVFGVQAAQLQLYEEQEERPRQT